MICINRIQRFKKGIIYGERVVFLSEKYCRVNYDNKYIRLNGNCMQIYCISCSTIL